MNIKSDLLEAAHKHSICNRTEIVQSKRCGCFYCFQMFHPNEVVEWTDEDDPGGMTALCPHCGMDSVLGDSLGFPADNADFLKAMYQKYFT